jgi:hypothetical protein
MNKLKNVLILLVVMLLWFVTVGCKSSKHIKCDAYGETNVETYDTTITFSIPYKDSFIMEPLHIHYKYDYLCLWVPADTLVYYDTLLFNFKSYKKYVR